MKLMPLTQGYGYASLPSTPVTPHTLFYTGSTTKSFTAAAISLLIDNSSEYQSIKWTTPVSQLLPGEFVLGDEWATDHVSIEDILSHRTGHPGYNLVFPEDLPDLAHRLRYLPMTEEPRVKFQYNNLMFGVAGYIVEKLSNTSLGIFFHRYLWEPMGLNETFLGMYDPAFQETDLIFADEYYYDNATNEYVRIDHLHYMADEGAGSIISNVLDYAKYLRIMMNESGPISKAGHRELRSSRMFYSQGAPPYVGPLSYTLGWMSGIFQDEQVWMHSGQVNQFTSWMLMVPSRKIGITVMTNSNSKSMTLVLYRILYELFNVKEQDRFDFTAKFKKDEEKEVRQIATCSERLYPNLPSPALPPTVPRANHTGTFHNPGYGSFEIVFSCPDGATDNSGPSDVEEGSYRLLGRKADGEQWNGNLILELEHKSSEYWLAWVRIWGKSTPDGCLEAQFRVNAQGVVTHFGFNARVDEDAPLTWFERV
ncbi:beta-lactamase/transpeptidase-like protein [Xylariales sp. PMI_506]|nr:beta-lactamase/transpeptidase-like protein [Xylariales sp. PMI_506]